MNKFIILLLLSVIITSCRTQKDLLYFQNVNDVINNTPELYTDPGIQTGDALTIIVSAFNPELARPFNLQPEGVSSGQQGAQNSSAYVVSSNGEIELPMLGTISVIGKTRQELAAYLEGKISDYIENPIVNVRYLNYRVTMLGEFNRPGIVTSESEKLNIIEAIAKSGDMTNYAIRDSIMLIRTVDGKRTKAFINLEDANIINSDYYYLRQNDVIYAMPAKIKGFELNSKPIRDGLTVLSFILTLYAIFK